MNRRNRHWLEFFQIILSIGIIVSAIFVIVDWKRYEVCFSIVFGLSAVLFALMGTAAVTTKRDKSRFGVAVFDFFLTILMIGMFSGSLFIRFGL